MQSKIAQDRKIRHNLRRLVNPTGAALSALSPVFKKTIRKMDVVDKQVRKEAENLNYYIGMAKSFFRRRDYLTCATYLSKFHEKTKTIHHKLNVFSQGISEPQREFLLKNFKANDKKHLFNYDPDKKIEDKDKYEVDDGLIATAGVGRAIRDWWNVPSKFTDIKSNFFDKKNRAMRAMEKNFSIEFFAQLKTETKEMMESTEILYKELLQNFHKMGYAWGARDVGTYVSEIKEINGNYDSYHKSYLEYHKRNIVPMIEKQKAIDAKIQKEKEENDAKAAEQLALLEQEKAKNAPLSVHQDPFPQSPGEAGEGQQMSAAPAVEQDPASVRPVAPMSVGPGHVPTNRAFPAPPAQPPTEHPPASLLFQENYDHINDKSSPASRAFKETYDHINDEPSPASRAFKETYDHINDAPKATGSHEDFFGRIEKLSDEHDIIIEILSYSEEVEKYSEEESLKLLAIAEGLIEKSAMPKKKDEAKTPKSPAPKVVKLEAPVPSEPYPASDPQTEIIPPAPYTQRSGPVDLGPGTRRIPEDGPGTRKIPEGGLPEPVKPKMDLVNKLHQEKFMPVHHNIPFGQVKKRWGDIPFLAKKRSHDIKVSPNAADSLVKGVVAALRTHHLPYAHIENFPSKFVNAIRHSITDGEVESNMQCSNNRDCQLQIFSGFYLEDIEPSLAFEGQAVSFTATIRLTDMGGDIIVGKITNIKIQDVAK